MTFIEIKGYGDFSCQYTDSVWSSEGSTLPSGNYDKENKPDKLIAELKSLGFKQVKTKSVIFGGGL